MATENKLTKEEILHLAHLARLSLSEEEISKYQEQLGQTIEYVKNLDELDTSKTTATNSVVPLKNVTFEDGEKSTNSLTQKEVLANSKNTKGSEFTVDRIMQ